MRLYKTIKEVLHVLSSCITQEGSYVYILKTSTLLHGPVKKQKNEKIVSVAFSCVHTPLVVLIMCTKKRLFFFSFDMIMNAQPISQEVWVYSVIKITVLWVKHFLPFLRGWGFLPLLLLSAYSFRLISLCDHYLLYTNWGSYWHCNKCLLYFANVTCLVCIRLAVDTCCFVFLNRSRSKKKLLSFLRTNLFA